MSLIMIRAVLSALVVGVLAASAFIVIVAAVEVARDWWTDRRTRARMHAEDQAIGLTRPIGPEDDPAWGGAPMTAHDPLCLFDPEGWEDCCCHEIAKARADERAECDRQREQEVAATARWCRHDERASIVNVLRDYGWDDAAQVIAGGSDG